MMPDQVLDFHLNKYGIDFVSKSTELMSRLSRGSNPRGKEVLSGHTARSHVYNSSEKPKRFKTVVEGVKKEKSYSNLSFKFNCKGMMPICYHITVTLSKKVEMENIRSILDKHEMDFIPITCPQEILEIRKNDNCFQPIKRHCDCDTTLGIIKRRGGILTKKERKKIRKQHSSPEEKLAEMTEQKKEELENAPETVQWSGFLRELLNQGEVWHIGLIIHWQSDPFVIKEVKKVRKDDITKDLLLNIEQDVWYEFTREFQY